MTIKNKYTIENGVVTIEMNRKNGDKYYTLIDEESLDVVNQYDVTWFPKWMPNNQKWYASASIHLGMVNGKNKVKPIYLHKIIADIENNYIVDHKNPEETLDNRWCNLRLTEPKNNSRNREGKNKNNRSGYRNVSWNDRKNKWMVQLMVDGKNTVIGEFNINELDLAGQFAEQMRNEIYGEFQGGN